MEINCINYNTQKTIDKLKSNDVFNHQQAERIVETIVDATSHLATKNDLHHLEQRFDNKFDQLELRINFVELKFDTKFELLEQRISSIKSDITAKMYIGMVGLGGVLIAAMAII